MTEIFTDPKDTPVYLMERGWERLPGTGDEASTVWFGFYEGRTTTMAGVLKRTAGNNRKFYVRKPTEVFEEAAHDGDCLVVSRDDLTAEFADLMLIHFSDHPDTFGDGIDLIEERME